MDRLDLYDYRIRVAEMYRKRNHAVEAGGEPEETLTRFRAERDALFATHSQSALPEEQKRRFRGLDYFPYNPQARVEGILDGDIPTEQHIVGTSSDETIPMSLAGMARFTLDGNVLSLAVYWIDVYGGGLFLPFRDATAPEHTYGGGRYLFDTVKGSDFQVLRRERHAWHIVLDFNYAYNPSCAYNYRWVCPLAPMDNRLRVPIHAGEKNFHA